MKKLIVAVSMFVATVMYAQVEVGTANVTGGTLDKGTGERSVRIDVQFAKPYNVKPQVMIGVASVDADKSDNLRYDIKAVSVSRDGFTIEAKTWASSKIYSMKINWMAYNEMKKEEPKKTTTTKKKK